MSRLASLRGPSAPSSPSSRSQPLAAQASALPHTSLASSFSSTPHSPPAKTPLQPASVDPSPQHRKMRAVLVEVERTLRDWEAVVRSDGGKAGKGLIDARTELDNMTVASKTNAYPYAPSQLPSDLLARLDQCSTDLRSVFVKLEKRLVKLNTLVNAAEALVLESVKTRGVEFTQSTPLWTTWSLEDFSVSLSPLLATLHASHASLRRLSTTLLSPSCTFDAGKSALEDWLRRGAFEDDWQVAFSLGGGWEGKGGRREWEECMGVEVKGWEDAFKLGPR